MSSNALTTLELKSLPLVASGKVRELFKVDKSTLLIVATDRVSVFDAICATPIPDKGPVLCQLSAHWFSVLGARIPDFKHHLLSLNPPPGAHVLSLSERTLLRGRCMTCRALKVFPIEVIVRGYLDGSAFAEYEKHGTVNSVTLEPGLQRCQAFPGGPMYTPSTKAAPGQKDENITRDQARELVGRWADRIEDLALRIYKSAHAYAMERGIVIADTKMEFGLDENTDQIIVVDELLTPDCSRFWPAPVHVGEEQLSFDKQPIRNYISAQGLKGEPGVSLPQEIVFDTTKRYRDIFERLTGSTLDQAIDALED